MQRQQDCGKQQRHGETNANRHVELAQARQQHQMVPTRANTRMKLAAIAGRKETSIRIAGLF